VTSIADRVPSERRSPGRQPNWVRIGGLPDSVHVSLSFRGDALKPSVLTGALRCQPSSAHQRGDKGPNRGKEDSWGTGYWSLDAGPWRREEISVAIERVLRMAKCDVTTLRRLARTFDGRLSCGVSTERWNRCFEISSITLERIAKRGLGLIVDIYAQGPELVDVVGRPRKKTRSRGGKT